MNAHDTELISADLDLDRGPRRAAIALIAVTGIFLAGMLVWMTVSKLEITVQATGKVVPSKRVQQIQSLEGGIVSEISVREGARVRKGDLLMTIDNQKFDSDLGESRESYWGLRAAIARLDAEIRGGRPEFDGEVRKGAPAQVARETQLWSSRRDEQQSAIAGLLRQLDQRRNELDETIARARSLKQSLAISSEQLRIEEQLMTKGAGAKGQLLSAQQEYNRIQGDLRTAELTIPRIESAIREAEARTAELRAKFLAEANKERNELQLKLSGLSQRMTAEEDKVSRRALRSPMDGIVNRLLVNTQGGVAKPGETLMEIIPVEDELLISAQVKPTDIAFLRADQNARVRVSAYDFSVYGSLDAKVIRVGADAVLDPKQENLYFEVQLLSDRNYLGSPDQNLKIVPGMTVEARITTGERSVLEYMLKPIARVVSGALQER